MAQHAETYAYPELGKRLVQTVDKPRREGAGTIWATKPETASRVRQRVEAVLNRATALGYRSGDNPARWRGHLDHILPAQRKVATVRHHPALPYAKSRRSSRTFASGLARPRGRSNSLILTAARTRRSHRRAEIGNRSRSRRCGSCRGADEGEPRASRAIVEARAGDPRRVATGRW